MEFCPSIIPCAINSEPCVAQLVRLKNEITKNRHHTEVLFHQGSAPCHRSIKTIKNSRFTLQIASALIVLGSWLEFLLSHKVHAYIVCQFYFVRMPNMRIDYFTKNYINVLPQQCHILQYSSTSDLSKTCIYRLQCCIEGIF